MKTDMRLQSSRGALRVASILVGVTVSAIAAFLVLRIGLSRALGERALRTSSLVTAAEAVRTSPDDPESYRVRSIVLAERGEFGHAIEDLRQAICLRPADYSLWTQLGRILDNQGDTASALAAFTEAQRLAPSYGTTCWDLGRLLVRLGRLEEGFMQLRNATLRKPVLLPDVRELAWSKYSGDPAAFQRALDPRDSDERIELLRFLIRNGKPDQSLSLTSLTESLSPRERRQIVRELITAKRFGEASELWQKDNGASQQPHGTMVDGGFEDGQLLNDEPFGWKISKVRPATISVSVDESDPRRGAHSLRIDWTGNPSPSDEPISQLLLVDPDTSYELRFSSRARNLITGGAPIVQITDVSGLERPLARSDKLPIGDSEWQDFDVEFRTGKLTHAIRIGLQREPCQEASCPAFGTLRLDDFSLIRRQNQNDRAE